MITTIDMTVGIIVMRAMPGVARRHKSATSRSAQKRKAAVDRRLLHAASK
jgi:hypothetical protein